MAFAREVLSVLSAARGIPHVRVGARLDCVARAPYKHQAFRVMQLFLNDLHERANGSRNPSAFATLLAETQTMRTQAIALCLEQHR